MGKLLIAASLIIIDEISMLQGCLLHSIDELLRKLTNSTSLFGGKCIIVTGDFKQVCPVIPGANKEQLIAMSSVSTSLWPHFTPYSLTQQFRISNNDHIQWVTKLGYGIDVQDNIHDGPWHVSFPPWIQCCGLEREEIFKVIDTTFGPIYGDPIAMASNQIICFTHEIANEHNEYLADHACTQMHSLKITLTAINTAVKVSSDIASAMATPEFIDSVDLHNLPPTKLVLFEGCIVALHRNIDVTRGLTNGAKLIVKKINLYMLRVQIISNGLIADLPCMKLSGKASNGIEFERLQFPIKLAYAITSNRSQGQTYSKKVIIDCRSPSFAHGQLYIACTRTTESNNTSVIGAPNSQTIAVTYQDLIARSHDKYPQNVQQHLIREDSAVFSISSAESEQALHPPEQDDYSDDSSTENLDD